MSVWIIVEDYSGSTLSNTFGAFLSEAQARNHAETQRIGGFPGHWHTLTWWEGQDSMGKRTLRIHRLDIQPQV